MTTKKSSKGGNFSHLTKNYQEARREYPQAVIEYCQTFFKPLKKAVVLDLGCGTGIFTRQIASSDSFTVGCDNDLKMLEVAMAIPSVNTSYVLGSGGNIPFSDNYFDIVAAFGSFHWIVWHEKEAAIKEIWRVLKSKGLFLVVNKTDISSLASDVKRVIARNSSEPLLEVRKEYYPEKILESSGFANIKVKQFETVEKFSIDEALKQVQSMSSWNFVKEDKREATLDEVELLLKNRMMNNIVERKLNVIVVGAWKT